MAPYTLQQLAEASGEKERTVRYYQQLGLLRQPGQIGPGAHYGEDDRLRLLLIRRLQGDGRSLADIAAHFRSQDDDAIRGEALSHSSALEYIRTVLGATPSAARPLVSSQVSAPAVPTAPAASLAGPFSSKPRRSGRATAHAPRAMTRAVSSLTPPSLADLGPSERRGARSGELTVGATAVDPPTSWRWERFDVVRGIELHVQLPMSAHRRRAITAYIERTRIELERMNS